LTDEGVREPRTPGADGADEAPRTHHDEADVADRPRARSAPEDAALAEFVLLLRQVTPHAPVMPVIVALNVTVYLVMVAFGVPAFSPDAASVLRWGANFGPRTLGGEPWRLLTSMFLHFGAIHVGMNMLALWNAGGLVERIFGSLRFGVAYLVAGLAGALASLLMHPYTVSAGASGAVFGVYGALGGFLVRQRGAIPPGALRRLSRVATGFVGYNLLFGFSHPNIDVAAHVGGLLGGAVAGYGLGRPLVLGRRLAPGRALAFGVAALLAIGASLSRLPRPPDFDERIAEFGKLESITVDIYGGLVKKAQADALTDGDFAQAIEQDVLPSWRKLRALVAKSSSEHWPKRQRQILDAMARYVAERDASWVELESALRAEDADRVKAASDRQQASVQQLQAEMQRLSGQAP
jgi:rhomboid protease GluP